MNALRMLPLLSFVLTSRGAEPAPGTVFYQNSYPEASAVAAVGNPARWIAVVDNELPRVVVYPLEPQSPQIHKPAVSAGSSATYQVDDLEAATVFPWDENGDGKPEAVYHVFAGSGSRTQKGKVRPDRDVLFALQINETALAAGKADAFPATVEYNRTLRSQIRALGGENSAQPWGTILRDSVWAVGDQPDQQNAALAGGGTAGLNIEGLTVSKDRRSLLLGLRSPLVGGKALLIPLTNPVAALGLGGSAPQPAALSAPLMLDLGGLGIRSIEWDAARGEYLIVAGTATDGKDFRFFTWNGEAESAPQRVTTPSATAAAKLDPEGVAPLPGFKSAIIVGDGESSARFHTGMWVDFGPGEK